MLRPFRSGREGIAYAVEHRPDVILLDLGLPDVSGLAAGRKILESWPDAKLVALTALHDPRAIWHAIAIGFRGYVVKATSVRSFIGCIEGVATGERVFPDLLVSEDIDLRHRSSTSIGSEGSAMFERFTDRARRAIVLTQEEARALGHNYLGTEHILLGLVHESEGVAAEALEWLNISVEAVRQEVEEIIGRGEVFPTGEIPFTPRAKKVLELSLREAIQLGHNHIGTEHILLGLIREGEGVAAQVLQKLGARLDRVRQTVIVQLYGYPAGMSGEMPTMQSRRLKLREDASPSPFEEREKIVLSLLIHEGLTITKIAATLGVSEEKVAEIIQAVIEKLKEV